MKNLLVTGGAGFIGSNFVRYMLKKAPESQIINFDALTYAGSLQNLKNLPNAERHTFVQGDICDRAQVDALMRQYEIDTIVHFAAESHVDRSILGPEQFIQTNVVGIQTNVVRGSRDPALSATAGLLEKGDQSWYACSRHTPCAVAAVN